MNDFDETGLYKGFVRNVKNQKYPPRDPQIITLPEARQCDGFCGVLSDSTVLMETDEPYCSNILQKIVAGEKLGAYVTDLEGGQGIHVLMINSDPSLKTLNNTMLACGIRANFRTATPSSYECLKYTGSERKPIYDQQPYGKIPKYFTPLPKCNIDLANLGKGDKGNGALYSYILTLQSAGLNEEDIRECIRIMNAYVLKNPLLEKELNTVLRDETFKKQCFFAKNKFRHDKFAEYIRNQYHIKKINGLLHVYNDGVYITSDTVIERVMLQEISSLSNAQRSEVLKYLDIVCEGEQQQRDNLNLIAFRNGVYNIETDTLQPFDPNMLVTNKIPWDYNTDAKSDLVDRVLNQISCNDLDIRRSLEEVAGACLYRSANIGGGMCAILVGDKQNGKSTYLHIIESMLGRENYSALDMGELKDRFSTIMLFGKLANIGDDISSEYIADTSVLKKMITGGTVKAEEKGKDPINFVPYATHIYSANDVPRMRDPTGAMLRRLLLIPLNGKFTKDTIGYDPAISDKLNQPEHMEYFIRCALDGLADLIKNKSFRVPLRVKEQLRDYELANNSVLAFIADQGQNNIINKLTDDVFTRYQEFCSNNALTARNKMAFSKLVNKVLGTECKQSWTDGKNRRIFRRPSGNLALSNRWN